MKTKHIKQHLELYRQGIDENEPCVQKALGQAANDSQLQSFLHDEASFNLRIQKSLQSISIPENLKQDILTRCAEQPDEKIIIFPWWAKVAAMVVLSGGLLVSFFGPTPQDSNPLAAQVAAAGIDSFVELESFAKQFLKSPSLASNKYHHASSVDEIRNYLLSHNLPEPHLLVKPVEGAERFDCTSLDYKGNKVSLVNFAEKQSGIRCHLFIAALKEFPTLNQNKGVEVREYTDSSAALWTCGERVYLMIVEAPREQLDIVMR